jgi:hypothetical protein
MDGVCAGYDSVGRDNTHPTAAPRYEQLQQQRN